MDEHDGYGKRDEGVRHNPPAAQIKIMKTADAERNGKEKRDRSEDIETRGQLRPFGTCVRKKKWKETDENSKEKKQQTAKKIIPTVQPAGK